MPLTPNMSSLEENSPQTPETPAFVDHRTASFHLRHNRRLIFTVLILAISYLTFGYDASIIGGCLAMPAFIAQFGAKQADGTAVLSASKVSIITATATAAGVPGLFICGYFSEKFGRKKTLYLGILITLFGTSMQTGASNVAEITVGRVIANLGYFVMVAMSATLSTEIAPPSIRGAIGALSVFFIQIASVLTSGISWGTHYMKTSAAYRIPLGLQNFFPLLIAIGLLYVKDSPTSFLIHGDDARAEESLRKVRQGYNDEDIIKEMETFKWQATLRKAEEEVKWTDIFRSSNRRRTLLSMMVGVSNNISGSIFATSYATIFLSEVGSSNPFVLVFGLSLLALGGSLVGLVLVDIIGRRTMALTAYASLFTIDIIIGGLGFADSTKPIVVKLIAAFCLMFAFFNAAFIGPLAYLNAAEFPTARLRNVTTAFTLLMFSMTSLATTYIIPYITNADEGNLGAKTYVIFAGFMLGFLVLTYFQYPEIKGRTAAELDEMFVAGLPARGFKGHQCMHVQENIELKMVANGSIQEIDITDEPKLVGH